MGNVIEDPGLSEPFTVYINAAGNPVQRQVREMAAPEAMLALHWAFDETTRLMAVLGGKLDHINALKDGLNDDQLADLFNDEQFETLFADMEASNADVEASEKRLDRINGLIRGAMPARYKNRPLREHMPKWWPYGRAA